MLYIVSINYKKKKKKIRQGVVVNKTVAFNSFHHQIEPKYMNILKIRLCGLNLKLSFVIIFLFLIFGFP